MCKKYAKKIYDTFYFNITLFKKHALFKLFITNEKFCFSLFIFTSDIRVVLQNPTGFVSIRKLVDKQKRKID